MEFFDRLALFSTLDIAALAFLIACWIAIGWRIEHSNAKHPSTAALMAGYRRTWMEQMVTRQPRVFDAHVLGTIRQSTAFFASTCVIALGGTIALIGNTERLAGVAADIAIAEQPEIVWELKLMVTAVLLTNCFLKFVWANRLFGYCLVVMAAVPNDPNDPKAPHRAAQAAEVNITAARSFNRGLRSIYFALASLAWLAGAAALVIATFVTCVVIWRREFASRSRQVLLDD